MLAITCNRSNDGSERIYRWWECGREVFCHFLYGSSSGLLSLIFFFGFLLSLFYWNHFISTVPILFRKSLILRTLKFTRKFWMSLKDWSYSAKAWLSKYKRIPKRNANGSSKWLMQLTRKDVVLDILSVLMELLPWENSQWRLFIWNSKSQVYSLSRNYTIPLNSMLHTTNWTKFSLAISQIL